MLIAVIGAGGADASQEDSAAEVGRLLAEAGAGVICGGLGGVMEAACRGAREGGGLTVGLLPGLDPTDANPYVDVAIPTGLGEGRNILVVRAAAALVAIGGGFGTLSEIGFALKIGKPVIGFDTWEPMRGDRKIDEIHRATDPATAVRLALDLATHREV